MSLTYRDSSRSAESRHEVLRFDLTESPAADLIPLHPPKVNTTFWPLPSSSDVSDLDVPSKRFQPDPLIEAGRSSSISFGHFVPLCLRGEENVLQIKALTRSAGVLSADLMTFGAVYLPGAQSGP